MQMKTVDNAKRSIGAAIQALQGALASDEPEVIANALAHGGNGIAEAIATMDGTFKGFRRDVENTAKRLADRAG
jgi:hypothetical protein